MNSIKIQLVKGDITKIEVDAIVNAANNLLIGGGGVDGAIHRAGGKQIAVECQKIRESTGGCDTGKAVITNAGRLKAKKIIHTVGPVWTGGNKQEAEKLHSCYLNSLIVAETNGLTSIAFPNISTGVYGFPKKLAAEIAISTVKDYSSSVIKRVFFICFDTINYDIYKKRLDLDNIEVDN